RRLHRLRSLRRSDGGVPGAAAAVDSVRWLRVLRRDGAERRRLCHHVAAPSHPMIGIIVVVIVFVVIPALLVYGTLVPNAQWFGPVITCFAPEGNEVWLTIDDGPTDDTLQVLDALDAKATFFVKGTLARERPELVRAILERGHTIGNHSDTHPSATFWCLPPAAIAREIDGGVSSKWFRAPVGMKNPFVHPALRRR